MSRPNRVTVLFCMLTALCEGIDLQAAGIAAAGIIQEYQPSPHQLGTFFSASTLGLLVGALLAGRLADRVGRKPPLVASVAMFGLFSLVTALAWDMTSLIWMRLLTGLGLGGAMPIIVSLASECSIERRRSATVAMVYASTPLGGALLSFVSMLFEPSQWRLIFVLGGVAPLIVAVMMALIMPESAAFRDAQAAARSRGGSRIDGVGITGGFLEIFAGGRTLPTLLLWSSLLLGGVTTYLLLNWMPTLMLGHGLTSGQAAGAQIGFNIGGAVAALSIGYMLDGGVRRIRTAIPFVVLPLAIALLANSPPRLELVVLLVFLVGCALLSAQCILNVLAAATYPVVIRGAGVGAALAVARVGAVIGPQLGGFLKAAGHTTSVLLMYLMPVVIVAGACALLLAWQRART